MEYKYGGCGRVVMECVRGVVLLCMGCIRDALGVELGCVGVY